MQPFPTNLAEIYRLIDDRSTFDRGKRYAHEGRVKLTAPPEGDGSENGRRRWECSVLGSKEYRVILQQYRDDLDIMWCSCPAFVRNGVCKHIAAALTYLVENGFVAQPTGLFTAPDAWSHHRPGSSLEQA